MAQADAIRRDSSQLGADPALRQGFLNNIPHHREIVAAWARVWAITDVPAESSSKLI